MFRKYKHGTHLRTTVSDFSLVSLISDKTLQLNKTISKTRRDRKPEKKHDETHTNLNRKKYC